MHMTICKVVLTKILQLFNYVAPCWTLDMSVLRFMC